MSGQRLVPITREFLRKHYETLVIDPEPELFTEVRLACKQLADRLQALLRDKDPSFTAPPPAEEYTAPKKIDENFYRNRQFCDMLSSEVLTMELVEQLRASPVPGVHDMGEAFHTLRTQMVQNSVSLEKYQAERTASVEQLIQKFLPQDFRMSLLRSYRERKEKANKEALKKLRSSGASVSEVYDALWAQQLARRETLVQLGQASGMFKMFLQLLAGVPQVLLDFVRTINDEQGPMEEMRARYGPFMYRMTELVHRLVHTLTLAARAIRVLDPAALPTEALATIARVGGTAYTGALTYYLAFMERVWTMSPFFIEPEQAGVDIGQELVVPAGQASQLQVTVPAPHWTVGWRFRTEKNDIGFAVRMDDEWLVPNVRVDAVKPVELLNAHVVQGSVVVKRAGTVTLVFDNTFSYFSKKKVLVHTTLVSPDAVRTLAGDEATSAESDTAVAATVTAAAAAAAADGSLAAPVDSAAHVADRGDGGPPSVHPYSSPAMLQVTEPGPDVSRV